MFIRKYKSLMLILFFTLLISLQLVDAKVNNILPLEGKIITIDPGHGGRDSGTMSGKLMEKDLNLEISYQLKKVLEENETSVNDYKSGKQNALKFLMGMIMKETKGSANPKIVNDMLLDLLSKDVN